MARWQYSGKSKQQPARSPARLNPDELRPALEECLKRGDCNFGGTKACRPHLRLLMAAVNDATPKSIQLGQLVLQSLTFGMLVGLEEPRKSNPHSTLRRGWRRTSSPRRSRAPTLAAPAFRIERPMKGYVRASSMRTVRAARIRGCTPLLGAAAKPNRERSPAE